jgi:hypothetical protein
MTQPLPWPESPSRLKRSRLRSKARVGICKDRGQRH